ncbi:sodium-dependent transporter [Proteinivorax tanatarense]|uniref:Sodium-dependent transporter n=1 Tax=Proteinivorax tanatarense TaxID=1260629 RepID=A0AAU7VPU3_9FIRM
MSNKRDQFGSNLGFIMAAAGSAIGLGNIWRFPTVVGQSGGGAFVMLYLLIILAIGVPIMIAELSVGRKGQRSIVGAFSEIIPGTKFRITGILGTIAGFIILSFYSVIAGWGLAYIFKFLTGSFAGLDNDAIANVFTDLVTNPFWAIAWHFIFMTITVSVVIGGIKNGIEKVSKTLMPILFFLLVALAIRSITLDGAMEGLAWFLTPDFSQITIGTVLSALGQVFFTLSLGMGAIMTYGTYLSKKENLPKSAVMISIADLGIAVLAGIIIIPAVFAFGLDPDSGPGLIFITLPAVFGEMPFGNFFGTLFFVLFSIAAVTSAISLLEVTVSYFIDELKWSRKKASILAGIAIFILGIPSALGEGVWSSFTILGNTFLDFADSLTAVYILPLVGLLTVTFVGWVWKPENALKHIEEEGNTFSMGKYWAFLVKWILPIILFYILASGIWDSLREILF